MQYLLTEEEYKNHHVDQIVTLRDMVIEFEKRTTPEDCPHNFSPPESAERKYCSGCILSSYPTGKAGEYKRALCTKPQHYTK